MEVWETIPKFRKEGLLVKAVANIPEPCELVWWSRRKTTFTGTRVLVLYGLQWNIQQSQTSCMCGS